jgi:hypothetical protein
MVYSRVRKPAGVKARNAWYLPAFLNGRSMRNNLFNLEILGQSNVHYQPVAPKQVRIGADIEMCTLPEIM